MDYQIEAPFTSQQARVLHAGDRVLLTGIIYTARDAAHKRMAELLQSGSPLPFPIENAVIYYVGPTPARPGQAIGSAGPTTSYRMDAYAPELIKMGQTGMIGKGGRSPEVIAAMRTYGAVYFGAIGGAGALLSSCITDAQVVAYKDLGAEAVRRLKVKNLPLTVVIDSFGESLYELGRKNYLAFHDQADQQKK